MKKLVNRLVLGTILLLAASGWGYVGYQHYHPAPVVASGVLMISNNGELEEIVIVNNRGQVAPATVKECVTTPICKSTVDDMIAKGRVAVIKLYSEQVQRDNT